MTPAVSTAPQPHGGTTPPMAASPASPLPAPSAGATAAARDAAAGPAVSAASGAAEARLAIDSFDRAFYDERAGKGRFLETTAGGHTQFWKQAEMLEMVEDACERSGDPTYRRMIGQLRAGIVARFGTDWLHDQYNDDVMWMVIAFLRAYRLTGDRSYRTQARSTFDRVWARSYDTDLGGGLWWSTSRREKNACVTAPAALAACQIARDYNSVSYLRKAIVLFGWLQRTLYDPKSGAVSDHICRVGGTVTIDHSTYTYNQGTFIGAAGLLYDATGKHSYYDEAMQALRYTRDALTTGGTLRSEGSGGDGGGFKGIFIRWATRFTRHHGIVTFDPWFTLNADAVWAHRNARGLTGQDWAALTQPAHLHSFDCSSAVVMLQARP